MNEMNECYIISVQTNTWIKLASSVFYAETTMHFNSKLVLLDTKRFRQLDFRYVEHRLTIHSMSQSLF